MTSKPLRILHASSTSTLSGANRYCFDLAAGQKDLGHNPIVLMPNEPGLALDFRRADVDHAGIRGVLAFSFLKAAMRLKPDVIHCHDGTIARWLRWMPARPPSLTTLHIKYKAASMDFFDGVHALADWQLSGLGGFKGKVRKINNWTPAIATSDANRIAQARQQAQASDADFLAVFIGRLETFVKGVDLAIDAVRSITDPRLKLAIVGVGKDEAELRERAAGDPRIVFTGYSSQPADWYGAADLILMPSRREPFALVALEAMQCGAPILAASIDGFPEIFRDRPDCLVAAESAPALATAISARLAAKTRPGIERTQYDMARFDRRAGIAAITDFTAQIARCD